MYCVRTVLNIDEVETFMRTLNSKRYDNINFILLFESQRNGLQTINWYFRLIYF